MTHLLERHHHCQRVNQEQRPNQKPLLRIAKHASRKSEAVLHKILHEAQWRITSEEDMLDKRKREREIRNSSPYDEELWPTSE